MGKIAIYVRVSKIEQHNENQLLRLVEYCKRNSLEYDVFEEKESSRKTRPVKNNLLNLLRKKEYDTLLIYKLDRYARSLQELILDFNELTEKGINIISLSENLDLSTANGKLQFHILGAFAEFERSIIRERTLEGLNRAKSEGKTLGRPPGSKDRKVRKKGGYFLRYMGK